MPRGRKRELLSLRHLWLLYEQAAGGFAQSEPLMYRCYFLLFLEEIVQCVTSYVCSMFVDSFAELMCIHSMLKMNTSGFILVLSCTLLLASVFLVSLPAYACVCCECLQCIPDASKNGCPVCLEDLHSSREGNHVSKCGHLIHSKCLKTMAEKG